MRELLDRLDAATARIKARQGADGAIPDADPAAAADVRAARDRAAAIATRLDQPALATALRDDADRWLDAGLDTPPCFDAVERALEAPADGGVAFFWGPLLLANAGQKRGHYLEAFLAVRDEPPACRALYDAYPHPKNICQSTHLVWGTGGLLDGNNIVFFPENIRTSRPVETQQYAIFFFNKFHDIYDRITVPTVADLVDGGAPVHSTGLDRRQTYEARCVWGYLHDYFHHRGVRPFDEHIGVKTTWHPGLLEEIKVDAQSALACLRDDVPYGPAIAEFILYERMFRYPQEPDYTRNFDAGTGVLLMAWLNARGALEVRADGVGLAQDRLAPELSALVSAIEEIEREPDDARYRDAARAFVHDLLPVPGDGARTGIPAALDSPPLRALFGKGPVLRNTVDLDALTADDRATAEGLLGA